MNVGIDKRSGRRLDIRLALDCRRQDGTGRSIRAETRNIGAGGVCFEVASGEFAVGRVWDLELTVPPGEGHFPYPGKVHGACEILRVNRLPEPTGGRTPIDPRFGVAGRFREPLKLAFHER